MLRLFLATRQGASRCGAPDSRTLCAGACLISGPVYAQLAATHEHADVLVEEAKAPPKGDGRTGSRAAGEGLSRPPLIDTQAYVRAADDLHESHIHALGEARMGLDQRSQSLHGSALDRGD